MGTQNYTTMDFFCYSSSLLQAQKSMQQARDEIGSLCGSVGDGYVVDVLVSCEGTWQRQGLLHSLELCLSLPTRQEKS